MARITRDGDGYGVRLVRKSFATRVNRARRPAFVRAVDVDDVCVNSATVATGEIKPPTIARVPKRRERAPIEDEDGESNETFEDGESNVTFDDEDYETFDDDARKSLDRTSASIDDRVVIVGMSPSRFIRPAGADGTGRLP